VTKFYDQLANYYHLIFPNWDETIDLQGQQLSALLKSEWPRAHSILDVSCGIGTQSIGLAKYGFAVTASDISRGAIKRAKAEAGRLGVEVDLSVCDMRQAHSQHGSGFDVVISCDNSLPHLLTDQDLLIAFKEMLACLSPGGGCVISVRDYESEERGKGLVKPYGVRNTNGFRYLLFQVWDFEDEYYDLTFYIIEENNSTQEVRTHALRSRYYAISTVKLLGLMSEAGFEEVKRIDGVYFQPILVGTKAT
jgi:SAM-dependent methyltransferase